MKINKKYKIHEVADEHVIMIRDEKGGMTKVMAFNATSLYLWNQLIDHDFVEDDVKNLLLDKYEIDDDTAQKDAAKWIKTLKEYGVAE